MLKGGKEWTEIKPMNANIFFPSGVIFNAYDHKRMMIMGGKDTANWLGIQINLFDIEKNEWRDI